MEKLKAKHDHSLTDILKVLIFSLFLLIPGIMFLPSMLYFGFNHEANAPVKEVQVQENLKVDFNQYIENNIELDNINVTVQYYKNRIKYLPTFNVNDVIYYRFEYLSNSNDNNTFVTLGASNLQPQNYSTRLPNTNGEYVYAEKRATLNNVFDTEKYIYVMKFSQQSGFTLDIVNFNLFNLTQMFGAGNEPTIEQFNTYFPNSYYSYTESQEMILTVDGPTEQVVDITTQLEWNWEQIWQRPILSWTKYSILKQGLDAFTNVFGVLQTSYITNLIAYELIMVAIYIVIDIVISIFKWLTHLIGTK